MKLYTSCETTNIPAEMDSKAEESGYGTHCGSTEYVARNTDSTLRLYGFALARHRLECAIYRLELFYVHNPTCLYFAAVSSITMFLLLVYSLLNYTPTVLPNLVNDGPSTYALQAEAAVNTLQKWYDPNNGLWDTTGWWNSANIITMLADFVAVDLSMDRVVKPIFKNTFTQAQKYNLQQLKVKTPTYVETFDKDHIPPGHKEPAVVNPKGFVNDYYDDEEWWALAWLRVYDHTHEPQYLTAAEDIFADLLTGWNATCGGLWWNKPHEANGAIENELFISVAAQLANRVTLESKRSYYRTWALKSWSWFRQSGMINARNTINDGLDLTTCRNNNGTVWSYNQGVILGALVELHLATPSSGSDDYIGTALTIAHAAIAALSSPADLILHEPCEPKCGNDGPTFKGVFMRNLQKLQQAAPDAEFKDFIDRNAQSVWQRARSETGDLLGVVWSGPFVYAGAAAHASAIEALVAAIAVG